MLENVHFFKQWLCSNYDTSLHVIVILPVSLISGCGCWKTSEVSADTADTLTCFPWLEHTPLCWCQAAKKILFSLLCLAAGTLGTSPRTLIQNHKKALLSAAAQAGFYCGVFSNHKAAACKWGKTSPKSWRSERHKHSSCSMSLLGLWTVHCVWYQQSWLENKLRRISVACLASVRVWHLCMSFEWDLTRPH